MRVRGQAEPHGASFLLWLGNVHSTLQAGPAVQSTWVGTGFQAGWFLVVYQKQDAGAFVFQSNLTAAQANAGVYGQGVAAGHNYQYRFDVTSPDGIVQQSVTSPDVVAA